MIRSALLGTLGAAALLASPAMAQDLRIFPNSGPTDTGNFLGLGGADQTETFRAEALRSDAYNIEASRMALAKSRNPRVRNYAERQIVNRQATTNALLPQGTALDPAGRVVSDTDGGLFSGGPLGLVTAPLRVTGTLVSSTLQGQPRLIDTRTNAPGQRVALDPRREQNLAQLQAAPSGRSFDAVYAAQQARSGADTAHLYEQQVRYGGGASQRFASEALPVIGGQASDADRISARFGGVGY
jgi:predicted outer membrane protein